MKIKSFEQDGVTVIQVSGEINISSSPELRKLLEKEQKKKMVIDFEKVTYIDSSGLATLVEVLKRSKTQGGFLGLAALSDKVKSLFEITKLDKLFSIFENLKDAIKSAQ